MSRAWVIAIGARKLTRTSGPYFPRPSETFSGRRTATPFAGRRGST